MPRIRDNYLNCVVYLYPSESAAEKGESAGGSGFLVAIPDKELGIQFTYVVTNRHVVESGSYAVRMNSNSGKTRVLDTDERDWFFHQDGDDLAVLLLRFPWKELEFSFMTPD